MNPYVVLKIHPNASKATIHKAYRRLAKKAHPDTGGDNETFARLKLAYEVLSDDARRAKYDATGAIDPTAPDNSATGGLSVLGATFSAVVGAMLDTGERPATKDIVAIMRDCLRKQAEDVKKKQAKLTTAKTVLQDCIGRFQTSQETNVLEAMAKANLVDVERGQAMMTGEAAKIQEALKILADYRFQFSAPTIVKPPYTTDWRVPTFSWSSHQG